LYKPKYADDIVALSVDKDISIQENLQDATDHLIRWTQREGMVINATATKTKVMVFGDQSYGHSQD